MKRANLFIISLALSISMPAYAEDSFWTSIKKKASSALTKLRDKAESAFVELTEDYYSDVEIVVKKAPKRPTPKFVIERKSFESKIEKLKTQVSQQEAWQVTPGRKGDESLPKTKQGVPYFETVKNQTKKLKSGKTKVVQIQVKEIPLLDIGTEKSLTKNSLVPEDLNVPKHQVTPYKQLKSPKLVAQSVVKKWLKSTPKPLKEWEPKAGEFGLGKVVTTKKVNKVDVQMTPEKVLEQIKPIALVTKNDLKMLDALLALKEGDKCHVAAGLLHDLSSKSKYKEEANYYLGVCAHKMGFHSEAVARLLKVIKTENTEFTPDAINYILEDLPKEYAVDVAKSIRGMKNQKLIPDGAKDLMYYVFAQAAHKKSLYKEAHQNAARVSEESPVYFKAQYLHAIGLYGTRQFSQALNSLLNLRQKLEKAGNPDKNLQALAIVNTARIYFIQEKYGKSLAEYRKTPKDHPVWVQALVEQGWAQLSIGDPEGAIGNMYSLHSPYFSSVFNPNSWVVRTVGYLDICQYGDAYRTLSKLENMHSSQLLAVRQFKKKYKKGSDYYKTVKTYLTGKSNQKVNGLPSQVIREIARRRQFLNVQGAINNKEDEISQIKFVEGMLRKDIRKLLNRRAAAKKRLNKHKANLKAIAKRPELKQNEFDYRTGIAAEKALIARFYHKLQVYNNSLKGYKRMRNVAVGRLHKSKRNLRVQAGKALKQHLREVERDLNRVLESNEFLRYEVFAGSGENIRYQVAGGRTTTANRIPASVRPEKIQSWDFAGEYWEDEIGSYRSSLRNNCPNKRRTTARIEQGEE